MGYEYTIKFEIDAHDEVSALLKGLPYFQHVHQFENRYQFIYRTPENDSQLPNGLAETIADGIYFCDYGDGRGIFKEMIFQLAINYTKIEVIDLSQ